MATLLILPILALAVAPAGSPQEGAPKDALRDAVLSGYCDFARESYAACTDLAKGLDRAVVAFLEAPSEQGLERARAAWLAGRRVFGRTEVLRFYEGPIDNRIDGVETFLNAWPLDEAYIDGVVGAPDGGIINDPQSFPNLSGTLLTLLNERGGEANVSIGWHAVEFLLWGQDLDPEGPGSRSYREFLDAEAANADRRREYLGLCTQLLVEHHSQVQAAWSDEPDSYARRFLAEGDASVRRMLAGAVILSGFELAGERLAVVYETGDQEDEHSCFSDNTHTDFLADQEGVVAVWFGARRGGRGPGLEALAAAHSPELAGLVSKRVLTTLEAVQSLPAPFDQAVRLDAPDPGAREAVLRALVALEQQAEALSGLALSMGFEIALTAGG
jgi:putative iron-regulated protein